MKKCYAFAFGGIPDMFRHPMEFQRFMKRVTDETKKCAGLIGVHPMKERPDSCLIVFDTLNNAKTARNRLRSMSVPCGTYIMHAEVGDDLQHMTVLGPTE